MSRKHAKGHHQKGAADNHENPAACRDEPRSVYPVRIEPTAEDNQWKTDQKTYWGQQLSLARWLNWITAGAGAVALVYAGIALAQWRQAGKNFTAQNRAWVGITDPVADSVSLQGNRLEVHGRFMLKNFGPSPAFRLYPVMTVVPAEQLDRLGNNACISAREWFDKGTQAEQTGKIAVGNQQGATIFPNQEIPTPFDSGIDVLKPSQSFPYVIVCMYYRDEFRMIRHTRLCLGAPWGGAPHPMSFCPWYNEAD